MSVARAIKEGSNAQSPDRESYSGFSSNRFGGAWKILMEESLYKSTKYFQTFEQREQAFRESVFSLIPRKYLGPRLFWKDFGQISLEELLKFIKQPIAYITSNPRDCLAFGTPWQVLTAVGLRAQSVDNKYSFAPSDVAEDFGIQENLYQPTRTLSGGETVKLSLAKSFIASKYSSRLIIASPFSWLSRDNSMYFRKLFKLYNRLDIPVELLALEGEDSGEQISITDCYCGISEKPVGFNICLRDVRVLLGSSLNPLHSQQTDAQLVDFETDLSSPCLIVGENGQGKSLIAKVLAGAIPFQGVAKIECKNQSGPARLLFQDVINQTMLRSFEAIAGLSYRKDQENPIELYEEILKAFLIYLQKVGNNISKMGLTDFTGYRTLLEIKAILVAVRLCGQPCALIIDEPDWGLTRAASIAFVSAIIKVSHELGTPVILISHKPWWLTIAKSTIRVKRTPKKIDKEKNYSFQIQLSCNTS
jgi:energy-coupling factor transporter ATP-binding protein EcfA2